MNDVLPTLISIGGWIGAAEFLLAYALVSKGRIAGDSLRYQALNLSASALLLINCARTGAWPSAIAYVFFIIVGVNVLLTVKRARIAQLARRRGAGVRSRLHRSRLHRGRRSRLSAA